MLTVLTSIMNRSEGAAWGFILYNLTKRCGYYAILRLTAHRPLLHHNLSRPLAPAHPQTCQITSGMINPTMYVPCRGCRKINQQVTLMVSNSKQRETWTQVRDYSNIVSKTWARQTSAPAQWYHLGASTATSSHRTLCQKLAHYFSELWLHQEYDMVWHPGRVSNT